MMLSKIFFAADEGIAALEVETPKISDIHEHIDNKVEVGGGSNGEKGADDDAYDGVEPKTYFKEVERQVNAALMKFLEISRDALKSSLGEFDAVVDDAIKTMKSYSDTLSASVSKVQEWVNQLGEELKKYEKDTSEKAWSLENTYEGRVMDAKKIVDEEFEKFLNVTDVSEEDVKAETDELKVKVKEIFADLREDLESYEMKIHQLANHFPDEVIRITKNAIQRILDGNFSDVMDTGNSPVYSPTEWKSPISPTKKRLLSTITEDADDLEVSTNKRLLNHFSVDPFNGKIAKMTSYFGKSLPTTTLEARLLGWTDSSSSSPAAFVGISAAVATLAVAPLFFGVYCCVSGTKHFQHIKSQCPEAFSMPTPTSGGLASPAPTNSQHRFVSAFLAAEAAKPAAACCGVFSEGLVSALEAVAVVDDNKSDSYRPLAN